MNDKDLAILCYTDYICKFPCAIYKKGEFSYFTNKYDIAQIAINKKLWA